MKLKFVKIFLNLVAYSLSILLILKTYENIIPEKKITNIKQKVDTLWIEVNSLNNVEQNFEIQNLTHMDFKKTNNKKDTENLVKKKIIENNYKLQLLSIKKNKFTSEIKEKIKKEFLNFNIGTLIFKEAYIPSLGTFIRVQTKKYFKKEKANEICKEIIKSDKKCIVLKS
ncbi:MAG: hypothetical protein CMP33_05340 [Rickettsiales bacterium]|nr:hypothetical protein [Rickettsiales bacterium]